MNNTNDIKFNPFNNYCRSVKGLCLHKTGDDKKKCLFITFEPKTTHN